MIKKFFKVWSVLFESVLPITLGDAIDISPLIEEDLKLWVSDILAVKIKLGLVSVPCKVLLALIL